MSHPSTPEQPQHSPLLPKSAITIPAGSAPASSNGNGASSAVIVNPILSEASLQQHHFSSLQGHQHFFSLRGATTVTVTPTSPAATGDANLNAAGWCCASSSCCCATPSTVVPAPFHPLSPWYHRYRLSEWLISAAVLAGASLISSAIFPYCRSFDWNDATISQPHKPNTFPTWSLAPVLILPCLVFGVVAFCSPQAPTLLAGGGGASDAANGAPSSSASTTGPSGATVVDMRHIATGATTSAYSNGSGVNARATATMVDETGSGSGRDGAALASPDCTPCCGGGEGGAGSSRFSRAFWMEVNALCLMQLQAIAVAFLICEPLKVFDGRLRPDFISRLATAGITQATFGANRSTYELCEGSYRDLADVKEGRKSFPSGHSLSAFVGVTPLALYLLSRSAAWSRGSFVRLIVVCAPLYALAFIIAATRTRDDWHHHSDILAGGVIGFLGGVVGFHLNFAPWGSVGTVIAGSPASFGSASFSPASFVWHLARHDSEVLHQRAPLAGARRITSRLQRAAGGNSAFCGVGPHEADHAPRAMIRMLDWRHTSAVLADAVTLQQQRRMQ